MVLYTSAEHNDKSFNLITHNTSLLLGVHQFHLLERHIVYDSHNVKPNHTVDDIVTKD